MSMFYRVRTSPDQYETLVRDLAQALGRKVSILPTGDSPLTEDDPDYEKHMYGNGFPSCFGLPCLEEFCDVVSMTEPVFVKVWPEHADFDERFVRSAIKIVAEAGTVSLKFDLSELGHDGLIIEFVWDNFMKARHLAESRGQPKDHLRDYQFYVQINSVDGAVLEMEFRKHLARQLWEEFGFSRFEPVQTGMMDDDFSVIEDTVQHLINIPELTQHVTEQLYRKRGSLSEYHSLRQKLIPISSNAWTDVRSFLKSGVDPFARMQEDQRRKLWRPVLVGAVDGAMIHEVDLSYLELSPDISPKTFEKKLAPVLKKHGVTFETWEGLPHLRWDHDAALATQSARPARPQRVSISAAVTVNWERLLTYQIEQEMEQAATTEWVTTLDDVDFSEESAYLGLAWNEAKPLLDSDLWNQIAALLNDVNPIVVGKKKRLDWKPKSKSGSLTVALSPDAVAQWVQRYDQIDWKQAQKSIYAKWPSTKRFHGVTRKHIIDNLKEWRGIIGDIAMEPERGLLLSFFA